MYINKLELVKAGGLGIDLGLGILERNNWKVGKVIRESLSGV